MRTRPGGEGWGWGATEARIPLFALFGAHVSVSAPAVRARARAHALCAGARLCRGADCRPRRRSLCERPCRKKSVQHTKSRTTGSCFDTTMPSPEIAGAHKPVRARASARHPPPRGGGGGCVRVRCQRAQRRKRVLAPRLGPRERARAHQRSLSSASEERARVGVGTQRASERVSASACACTGARAAGGAKKWLEFPPIRAKKKKTGAGRNGPRARVGAGGARAPPSGVGLPPRGARPPGMPTACQRAWRERLGGASGR